MNFFKNALDFIFPISCGICNQINRRYLCQECEKKIEKYLYNNKDEEKFHVLKYEDIIREKMIDYKFNDESYLYHLFSEIILNNPKAKQFLKECDIIIPVPIHSIRKRLRGYNQSELVAKEVSKKLGIILYTDILKKQRNTTQQSKLGKKDRIKNVQGVYKVENIHKIIGKTVVIFDDIYTTGATTQECKKILLKAGAKEIRILTIAKD